MQSPPFQIWITTYEISSKGLTPTLSHVFYGNKLEEAYGYARSHLITDYFFSASFVGSMPWGNTILRMTNEGNVINAYRPNNENETQEVMNRLALDAQKIVQEQNASGMVMLIQEIKNKV